MRGQRGPPNFRDESKPPISTATLMQTNTKGADVAAAGTDPNLIYVNGIDPETGAYAVPPRAIKEIAKGIRRSPSVSSVRDLHGEDASLIFDDEEIATYLAQVYDYDWTRLATAHPTQKRPRVAGAGERTPPGMKRVSFSEVFDD